MASDGFKQLVKEITDQIAAAHRTMVSREEIRVEQVKNKPPQAIPKIVEGKLEKFCQTCRLVDQGFVKRNSGIPVKEEVGQVAKQLEDEIAIRRFMRFQVGKVTACLVDTDCGAGARLLTEFETGRTASVHPVRLEGFLPFRGRQAYCETSR